MCKSSNKFVQLHCHSDASLLDGAASVEKLVKKAKEYGHPALALTDHGNPSNIFQFYKECRSNEIKPIIGLEFYICNDLTSRISNKQRNIEDKDYHQSAYIKNRDGYRNYCELVYRSYTDGYYYKPRIDFDSLFEKKRGLIITSSCMASKISQYILNNDEKKAKEYFKKFLDEFGDDFYGEIQLNEIEGQKKINEFIIRQCGKYDIPIIIGGDVHYVNKEDNVLQDAIIKSKRSTKTEDSENDDWVISARNLYFHDTKDYIDLNKKFRFDYDIEFIEKCIENSYDFSKKINFEFETGKYNFPKINTGKLSSKDYLEQVVWEGFVRNIEKERIYSPDKYSDKEIEDYEKQIEYELKVIDDLELNDYLLIVYDVIDWALQNNIRVGPGRGSAAGSAVCWCLRITSVPPLEHGLLFERFINPSRKTPADVDSDFEAGAREKILSYLIEKYGRESVVNVGTFGQYQIKSALQDMSRGLKKETGQDSILMKKITKLPEVADDTKDWNNSDNEIKSYFDKIRRSTKDNEIVDWVNNNQDTIDFSQRIQGQIRNIGTHAGGIVITPGPVYNFIPVTRGSGNLATAFKEADGSSKDLSELGILKLDVLGLRTLNIFSDCIDAIKKDKGIDLNEKIYYLDLTDKKILNYFATGNNYGIFQMDRSKMFTDKIKIDSFDDIVAINAMNRPGPLEKFLNKYGYWKEVDKKNIELSKEELEAIDKERYPFAFMRKTLEKTYGCLLYQEQFMQLMCDAAGFNFGEADSFRRVFGWAENHPKYHTVATYYEKLESGMKKMGYDKKDVDRFVQYCKEFSGYSFNKSHSLAYSYVSWQTLYFKVYYPAYFYAALLNLENDIEVFKQIISDAKKNNIQVLSHSIIKSKSNTIAESDSSIRLGFKMLKGFGQTVIDELEEIKIFDCKTIQEVLRKPFKKLNSTNLQNLIDIGGLDDLHPNRNYIQTLKDLYQDPDILKWFTRTKQALKLETMPKVLKNNFDNLEVIRHALNIKKELGGIKDPLDDLFGDDNDTINDSNSKDIVPNIELIDRLLGDITLQQMTEKKKKEITIKKQNELIGFSLLNNDLILQFEETLRINGILPLKEYEKTTNKYYFLVSKILVKKTKTGKEYLSLSVTDGYNDYNVKCWKMLDLEEGKIYSGRLKKDSYGWTLESKNVEKQL